MEEFKRHKNLMPASKKFLALVGRSHSDTSGRYQVSSSSDISGVPGKIDLMERNQPCLWLVFKTTIINTEYWKLGARLGGMKDRIFL